MISALLSFLGGSAFRMIFGAVSEWFDKKQEHQHELERIRIQSDLDKARHEQDCQRLRLQSELGVKEIMVKADADVSRLEADAFVEAMRSATKPIGIKWVDAWNGVIRPLAASIAIILWVLALNESGWMMSEWDKELVGVILGFFFASRALIQGKK